MRADVYVVAWPTDGIVKVGMTSHKRYRAFLNRGAELLALVNAKTVTEACDLEDAVRRSIRPFMVGGAFVHKAEAVPYLGGRGGGYMECSRLGASDLTMLRAMLGAMLRAYAEADARASV
jgi:hypothetical protein